MKIIRSPRQAGKTTRLIEIAHEGRYKIIVCHSREEADRIFQVAIKMDKKVPLPITYDDYLKGNFYGKNIESFLIDNVDMFITYLAKGVPVEAITLSSN